MLTGTTLPCKYFNWPFLCYSNLFKGLSVQTKGEVVKQEQVSRTSEPSAFKIYLDLPDLLGASLIYSISNF